MSTIIGFILPEYFENLEYSELPMGFSETGKCVYSKDSCLKDCKLIYLNDEDDYTNGNIQPNMQLKDDDNKKALLFQHNSKSQAWNDQIEWLKRHNWDPKHIDGFSHTSGDFFDTTKDLLKLLSNVSDPCQARSKIIDRLVSIVSKYENRDLFKKLDEYVIWEILYFMDGNTQCPASRERTRIRRSFPKDLSQSLPDLQTTTTIETLTNIISTANKQAFDLLKE